MSSKISPVTPAALSIFEVLEGSAPLGRLRAALRDSNDRFDIIRSAIPLPLQPHVRPGPVDLETWSLLAANPSVAAKLRQLAPRFEALLEASGRARCEIRIKVSSC